MIKSSRLRSVRVCVLLIAAFSLSACAASYRNHGYVPSEELLQDIVVGVDTRDSVAESVGSPSSAGLLQDSAYYYVRSRTRTLAFRAPETIEREVLAISFDRGGVVSNIERFGLEDGRVVAFQRRVTESSVVDQVFLRQLLGGIGQFNPGGL